MTRIYKILIFPFLLLVTVCCLFSCGVDRWKEYAPEVELDTWMYDIMQENYLWYDQMPSYAKVNPFLAPDQFLAKIKWESDSYSYVDSIMTVPLPTYGFDYSLVSSAVIDTAYNALVTYVIPNSPAALAGLKRGDWIMKVDTSYISKKYEAALLQGTAAESLTLGTWQEVILPPETSAEEPDTVYRVVENGTILSMQNAESLEDNPVHKDTILTLTDGSKVGYLMYNSFTAGTTSDPEKYNDELRRVSNDFQNANITATILDLRYNAGGTMDCVQLLGSILVPSSRMDSTMLYTTYSEKNKAKNSAIPFTTEVLQTGVNLNQNTLIVITSGTTAGAAEMITTGLYRENMYPNITVIGSASKGQMVATERFENPTLFWAVNPVVCTVANNAKNESTYLTPATGYTISETSIDGDTNYSQFLPFGDPNERMLKAAIQILEGTYNTSTRSASYPKQYKIKIEKSVASPASRKFKGGLRIN